MNRRLAMRALAAAAALSFAVIAVACGSDATAHTSGAPTEHEHAQHEVADDGDGVLEVEARDDAFISEHATVAAGSVPIRLVNAGEHPHQLQIGKLRHAMTPEQFIDLFEERGDRASVDALTWVGGINAIEPGASGEATADLTEGDYLMVCYVPGDDGDPHVVSGMVTSLHVAAKAPTASLSEPIEPKETVVLRDFQIQVPLGFRGRGPVAFRNEGTEPHEVVLLRLKEGKTLADAAAYDPGGGEEEPFTFAGGVGSVAPGTRASTTLDLEPGDYLATCFVPAEDGTPHVDLGMVAAFTVP
jgi:uncharacterized cupredoxin-like copper-binding protein